MHSEQQRNLHKKIKHCHEVIQTLCTEKSNCDQQRNRLKARVERVEQEKKTFVKQKKEQEAIDQKIEDLNLVIEDAEWKIKTLEEKKKNLVEINQCIEEISQSQKFRHQELKKIEDKSSDISIQIEQQKKRLNSLKQKLNKGKDQRSITDHAIVRYLERYVGVDIKALREEILHNEEVKKIEKNGKIVTVEPPIDREIEQCKLDAS